MTEPQHLPRRRQRLYLALVALGLAGVGCLISPPINERPPELDVRFVIDRSAITPSNDGTVFLDRSDPDDRVFGVLEVRDPNPSDEITATWEIDVDGTSVFTEELVLIIDTVASEEAGVTIYEPVTIPLNPCQEEFAVAVGMTVSLFFEDEIPPDQVDPDDRIFSFNELIVWSVRFENSCP